MKIVVSKNLYNHYLASVTGLVAHAAIYAEEVNPNLEETKEAKTFFNGIPFYGKIKNATSKIGTIVRTDEAITIDVNDEFITDIVDLTMDNAKKCVPLVLSYIKIAKDFESKVDTFAKKWADEPTDNE